MKLSQLLAEAKSWEGWPDHEVKIWLPGSTISLGDRIVYDKRHSCLLIEGNVDEGSALEREG